MKMNNLIQTIACVSIVFLTYSCKKDNSPLANSESVTFESSKNIASTSAATLVINEDFNAYSGSYQNYTRAMLDADFNGVNTDAAAVKGFDSGTQSWPQNNVVGSGKLRAHYPANTADGTNSGFIFDKRFTGTTEAIMEYRVYFQGAGSTNTFKWAAGGKLPGLGGENSLGKSIPTGCTKDLSNIENGFSARFMWRSKSNNYDANQGQLVVYTYLPDRDINKCGVDIPVTDLEPNTWYTIKQYIKLNSIGSSNGVMKVWVNGSLKLTKTNIVYRKKSNILITSGLFHTYRGGKETNQVFWSPVSNYAQFDYMKVWRNTTNGSIN